MSASLEERQRIRGELTLCPKKIGVEQGCWRSMKEKRGHLKHDKNINVKKTIQTIIKRVMNAISLYWHAFWSNNC